MEINQTISPLIERQFPAIYREESPLLVAFLKCYYEWAEQDDNFIKLSRSLFQIKDIDTTFAEYGEYFRSKYLNQLPDIFTNQLMPNLIAQSGRFMVKHVLDLYRSKGTERGYKILFRALYNNDVEFYYPGRNLLRASDGVWEVPQYIEITYNGSLSDFEGRVIQIVNDGTQNALCDRAFKITLGKVEATVLFLKNIVGQFNFGNLIHPLNAPTKLARIVGSLSSIQVTAGGGNYKVGDVLNVESETGVEGLAIVRSTINANGGVTFKIINGGYGYSLDAAVLVTGGNGFGATFKVGTLANTQSIQIINDQLLSYVDTALAAFGLPGPGTVSVANGQSNVTGVGTTFTTTFANADLIYVVGEGTYKQIINITNNTLLTVNSNYSKTVSGTTYIDLGAPMTTGNVSFTTGNSQISGNGTTFTTDFSVGDFFKTGNQVGIILNIANNTQLTISENMTTTNTGVAYFKDYAEYTLPSSIVLREYVGTRLKDALNITTSVIGRIDSLTKINPGSGYISDPSVSVIEAGILAMRIYDGNGNYWGNNAVIEATAGNIDGIITSVQVVDSGFGYKQGEGVVLTSNANPAFIGLGISNVGRVGKKQGYWKNNNGFLSADKYLIDSYYFQEFSYELQTERDITVWGDIVNGAIHQAGTKMFGKVIISGEDPTVPRTVDNVIEQV